MSFRTILTVTGPEQHEADLELAAQLAEAAGAHLAVFVVGIAMPPPVGDYGAVGTFWLEQRDRDLAALEARSGDVSAWVAARSLSSDVAASYTEQGRADEVIGRRARFCDLTVVGPELKASPDLCAKTLEGALFHSDKPLLLVPAGAKPTLRPATVVVGWDGRIEASRAVRAALDLLKAAGDVRLAIVDPVEATEGFGEEPGADAATFLARHGVTVTIDRIPAGGHGVAGALARHATDCGAELLVMGAYGHSRLRERLFGGVTRAMLEGPPVPLLLAR